MSILEKILYTDLVLLIPLLVYILNAKVVNTWYNKFIVIMFLVCISLFPILIIIAIWVN